MSLLAHSSLPHDYWEHTFKRITYVHNRTIAPSHQLLILTHPTPQFIKKDLTVASFGPLDAFVTHSFAHTTLTN